PNQGRAGIPGEHRLLRHPARRWDGSRSAARARGGGAKLRAVHLRGRGGDAVRAHVAAIKALIPAPYTVYFVDVPAAPVYPYVLLWTSAGAPGLEASLCGTNVDLDAIVGVTHVAASTDSILT